MSRSKKFISLAEHNPELVAQWHPTLNEGLTPENISYGSSKKIHWKCSCGFEWEASPNKRSQGRGCPNCAKLQRIKTKRKNIVAKRGSLADNNPQLALEWHPTKNGDLSPQDVSVNSPQIVSWRCLKDERHEWEAAINSRNSGSGCPVCSGHKLVVGINDLATIRPDIAAEWHPTKNGKLNPTDVTCGSDKEVSWICKKNHIWKARVNNRCSGNNCPVCIGKKVLVGYNDLATLMPMIASEWHPTKNGDLKPTDVTLHSNKKVYWQCEKGHVWETEISHRSNGQRCPKCFGESRTSFPEQAIYFYLRNVTTAHNRHMIDSKTEIDVYLPEYKIGIEYDGKFFHNNEKAKERENRKQNKLDALGIKLIRVREIEDEQNENIIYSKPGASDFELTQTIQKLCKYIDRAADITLNIDIDVERDRNKIYEQYVLSEKENSLAALYPEIAAEWHPTKNKGLLPEYVSAHSNKYAYWQCKEEKHEWKAQINSRSKGSGCPFCYNSRRIKKTTTNNLTPKSPKTV